MGSLPHVTVLSGARRTVPVAPLTKHLAQLANDEDTALVYTDETCTNHVSYSKLHSRTNALARAIVNRARQTGANREGDYVVAVCMQPTHNTVMALLSIWKAGAAYVPMEPSFPQARISHILKDAEPALVIYDETANSGMFSVNSVSFEELLHEASGQSMEGIKDMEMLTHSRSDSIAIVLYTSGSTGIPKGVRIPYSAICNRLWWQFRTFPYSDTERVCVWKTSLTFVDSVSEVWGPLLQGRTLVIFSKESTRDPQKLVRILSENQVERLILVPTLLRSILMYLSLNQSERPLRNLKLWICSGETLSKDLAAQFFKYFGDYDGYKLANFYGSTEVMGDVTYYVLENGSQLDNHPTIPIGLPLDNCGIYLLDEARQPAAAGELWVCGHNLAAGYVGGDSSRFSHNPHASHPDFSRIYRTGDFGVLSKGVILYAGRTDSQVKIRGHRVDLQEVERAVSSVQGVEKCVVLCYGLDSGNPEILAFVTLDANARLNSSRIENNLQDKLTSYMIPQVIIIDTVPQLVNGKVDRQALLKMYETTNNNDDSEIPLEFDYSGINPEHMEAAKVLFQTVGDVLGRAVRGVVSSRVGFYELGGNSLNSIYTITTLRERGYFIDITEFLQSPTLGDVLSHLTTNPDCLDDVSSKYTAEPMRDEHREIVTEMIISSFYEKAELEQFVKSEIVPEDYARLVNGCWRKALEVDLSVVLKDESDSVVAVALNFDANDEPEVEFSGGIAKIMAFLEFVEGSVRHLLPTDKGAVLHCEMMATGARLAARDNVAAIQALERATAARAAARAFRAVFTTNTSPLTQQLGKDVLGFQTLLDYQINQYVDAHGNRIFGEASDDMRAIVCWKAID